MSPGAADTGCASPAKTGDMTGPQRSEDGHEGGNMTKDVAGTIEACLPWTPTAVPEEIPHGDMPGDMVNIVPLHIEKANRVFPSLAQELLPVLRESRFSRAVVAVSGGSGVGKSEIASVLSFNFRTIGVGSYTLSGDNYPRRIPKQNDSERLRVFRQSGVRGLIASGQYTEERSGALRALQVAGADADPARAAESHWISVYQRAGRCGLKGYLGTPDEIDFDELSNAVSQFKNGADGIYLRRMGREEADLWYDFVDFSEVSILVIEWTHGSSDFLQGVDVTILLNSTPAETLEHRKARNRDGATDSPFTTMVLGIEQELLEAQEKKARIILSKSGARLPCDEYHRSMAAEGSGPHV